MVASTRMMLQVLAVACARLVLCHVLPGWHAVCQRMHSRVCTTHTRTHMCARVQHIAPSAHAFPVHCCGVHGSWLMVGACITHARTHLQISGIITQWVGSDANNMTPLLMALATPQKCYTQVQEALCRTQFELCVYVNKLNTTCDATAVPPVPLVAARRLHGIIS